MLMNRGRVFDLYFLYFCIYFIKIFIFFSFIFLSSSSLNSGSTSFSASFELTIFLFLSFNISLLNVFPDKILPPLQIIYYILYSVYVYKKLVNFKFIGQKSKFFI